MNKDDTIFIKVLKLFKFALQAFCAFTICMLVIILAMQIVNRNFLGHSFTWVEELAGISMIYLTFLGSVLSTINNTNTRIDFFVRMFPKKITIIFNIITDAIVIVFLLILGKLALKAITGNIHNLSAAMKLPVSFNYAGMFAGLVLMAVFYGVRIYIELENFAGKDISRIEEAQK